MLCHVILSELQRRGKVTAENQETVARAILDELHKEEYMEIIKRIQLDAFKGKDSTEEIKIVTMAILAKHSNLL